MKKINCMADLEGVKRALKAQRLDTEQQEKIKLEKEKKHQEEKNLFKTHMQDVIALPGSNRKIHNSKKPQPIARQRDLDNKKALSDSLSDEIDVEMFLETDDKLSYRRNGVSLEALKRLRRGHWVIQRQIDLHGMRSDEARLAVAEFLHDCVTQEKRCVRIIHGKGLGSIGKQPVLKEKLKRWLVQKEEVLAFCQAPPRDGGAGAMLVILKSKYGK